MKRKTYPKYKPSGVEWLGDVPEHWEVKRLSYLATLKSGENITSEMIAEGGDYPVYGGNGLRGNYHKFTHRGHHALIGRQGALCGNVNYASGEFYASEHALVVSPLKEYSVVWMGELLRAMNLGQYSVTAAQPGIAAEVIRGLRIPAPPLPEQRAIAAFLDRETGRIDALIAKKRELVERLKEKRTALISHTVTHGLSPEAARAAGLPVTSPLKPSGIEWIGDIPAHWGVTRLKHATARIVDCPHETPIYSPDGEYLVIRTADLDSGILLLANVYRVDTEEYLRRIRRERVVSGDILYGREGERWGFAALVPVSPTLCLGQRMMQFRSSSHYSNRFLMWQLNSRSVYEQGAVDVSGSTAPHVNVETIQNYWLTEPPLPEQNAIAAYLSVETAKLDALAEKVEEAVERLQEYRTALITAAVTGKIDVRGNAIALRHV